MSEKNYPHTLTLKHPIQFGSEKITEIKYGRIKAKNIRSIKTGDMSIGDLLDVFAMISDQTPPAIAELDAEDAVIAVEIVSGFLGSGQTSGT